MKSNLTAHGVVKRISGDDMTHDELLAKIESNIDKEVWLHNMSETLRAVVELHKPSDGQCYECHYEGRNYPCHTIQAIEKELN
jgi:hypothetical protein